MFSPTPAGTELARVTQLQRNAWLETQLAGLSAADQDVIARACVLLGGIADS